MHRGSQSADYEQEVETVTGRRGAW